MLLGCFHQRAPLLRKFFGGVLSEGLDAVEEAALMAAAAAAAVNGPWPAGQTRGPSCLFSGGTIRTMADDAPTVEAMLVRGNRIVALGALDTVRAQADHDTREIPLDGRTLLPGFIDPHLHIVASALSYEMIDIGPQPGVPYSWGYVKRLLLEAIHKAGNHDTLILGTGIDPSQFVEWVNPTVSVFDEMFGTDDPARQNPVLLQAGSGHISFLNRRALAMMPSVNPADPPPVVGGKVASYLKEGPGQRQGEMSGVLLELTAQGLAGDVMLHAPGTLLDQGWNLFPNMGKLFHKAVAAGNTMLNDAGRGIVLGDKLETMVLGAAQSAFHHPVRLGSALFLNESDMPGSAASLTATAPDVADPMFLKQAIKLFADGSNQGATGLLRDAYTQWTRDRVGQDYMGTDIRGIQDSPAQTLTQLIAAANRRGWQVMIHANGDAAIDNALAAFADVRAQGLLRPDLRHRIEHCSLLHDDRIAMMADLGLSPSFLIEHVVKWGPVLKNMLGDDRVQLLDRCLSAHKAGMAVSLHSDYTVSPMHPLKRIQDAVTRLTEGAEGGWILNPDERLPIDLALKAQTRFAAWQCHADRHVGTLEVGKLADFVILEDDPVAYADSGNAGRIATIKVSETWVDGYRKYRR